MDLTSLSERTIIVLHPHLGPLAMPDLRIDASFPTVEDYLTTWRSEGASGGLLVRGALVPTATAMAPCTLVVRVGSHAPVEVEARIAAIVPGVGVAVMFPSPPTALQALAERLGGEPGAAEEPGAPSVEEDSDASAPRGTVSERLKALNVAQKMALALSGDRETRFALMRDTNKVLHLYVLRNPRIGLDEVQYAAKLTGLSPDALKFIAEHREWGANATVCTALVRNPKTPLPIALRLLPKLPLTEVRAIAKGGARDQIVQAARKRVNA